MSLTKVNYVAEETVISTQNLNNIQDSVIALQANAETGNTLTKVNYVDKETKISAKNLNDIQDAIIALENNSGGSSVNIQESKSVTITSNGATEITPDAPYDALAKANVTVNVASGGVGPGTITSLKVTPESSIDATFFCIWQTSDGWMGTANFDASENFTIPNVIVGGYVILTHDPNEAWHFSTSFTDGVEPLDVGAMDAQWDIPNAALVLKVTAPSPKCAISLLN